MDESGKRVAPFGLRLPPDLKGRVQKAADQHGRSMNALILSVLEREFPQPTIDLHDVAAFLSGVSAEWEEGEAENPYIVEVNRGLGTAKTPWTIECHDGVVSFYPYADPQFRGRSSLTPKADDLDPAP